MKGQTLQRKKGEGKKEADQRSESMRKPAAGISVRGQGSEMGH